MPLKASSERLQFLSDGEEKHIAGVVAWISAAGILLLSLIGGKSWLSGHVVHGQILMLFAVLMTANFLDYRLNRKPRRHKQVLLLIVGLLFTFLVATGGEDNTGPLWLYVFPPLVFFLTGLTVGLTLTGMCVTLACVVFLFPDLPFVSATYSAEFKLRFLITLLFETAFCFVFDYSRRRARHQLMAMAALYEQAARTDELTGLSNRRDGRQQLAMALSRYERNGHPFSVILLDLDHFKKINDAHGHEAGDQVLVEFSELLRNHCRKADVASRWGGEEFLVLLPDTALLQTLILAERLRAATENAAFVFQGQRLPVSISAGVCAISQYRSIESLLRQADLNLYQAKSRGRNRLVPRVKSGGPRPLPGTARA